MKRYVFDTRVCGLHMRAQRQQILFVFLLVCFSSWVHAGEKNKDSAGQSRPSAYLSAPQAVVRVIPPGPDMREYQKFQQEEMSRALSGKTVKETHEALQMDAVSQKELIFGMPVEGGAQFRKQLKEALFLLKMKAYTDYEYLLQQIRQIKTGEHSGVAGRIIQLREDTVLKASVFWIAASLIHEACHADVENKRQELQNELKSDYEKLRREELKCNGIEAIILRKVQAPDSELAYLEKADGTHFDVNRDGKYDWKDYENRNW